MPVKLLEETVAAAREFHELPREVKGEYYSRELMKKVKYGSNFDLYQSKYANWRDTLFCVMDPEPLDPQELPPICRTFHPTIQDSVDLEGSCWQRKILKFTGKSQLDTMQHTTMPKAEWYFSTNKLHAVKYEDKF
ncbi:1-aminocyclopropane-1-carboxylate oxidase-like 2 [Spatholobus suberectus]|nr:1-aminocyclopropane-1-carboxylate oxidase-like 2 [Spatholobus suberectus]